MPAILAHRGKTVLADMVVNGPGCGVVIDGPVLAAALRYPRTRVEDAEGDLLLILLGSAAAPLVCSCLSAPMLSMHRKSQALMAETTKKGVAPNGRH